MSYVLGLDYMPAFILRQALTSIKVKRAELRQLRLPPARGPRLLTPVEAREVFLDAAATPEQRLQIAEELECSYDQLTQWVIRADLMRLAAIYLTRRIGEVLLLPQKGTRELKFIGPDEARALAEAGVLGVRDLADRAAPDEASLADAQEKAAAPGHSRWEQLIQRLPPAKELTDAVGHLKTIAPTMVRRAALQLQPRIVTHVPVLLVVKGAGVQKPDETLNQFLGGFWPAVKLQDSEATLTQRQDIFPAGYRASPHEREPHNHVTEVRSGEHTLWIREVNWEAEVEPPNVITALLSEWKMASYAFVRSIAATFRGDERVQEAWQLFVKEGQELRDELARASKAQRGFAQELRETAQAGRAYLAERSRDQKQAARARAGLARAAGHVRDVAVSARSTTLRRTRLGFMRLTLVIRYALYYNMQHVLLIVPALIVAAWHVPFGWPLASNYVRLLAALYVVGNVAAIVPATVTSWRWARFHLSEGREKFETMPAAPNWLLLTLVTAILIDPPAYFALLGVLLLMEISLIVARRIAWPFREVKGTDTDGQFMQQTAELSGRKVWVRRHSPLLKYCQYLYRHLVVLTLPLALLIYTFARILRLIPFLESLGIWLEKTMTATLSGGLGDVVGYATNPAHAHRVQSAVASDIHFFQSRPQVAGVHVFAHSMGTPITYETLFHHLEPQACYGIKTYVTIGSVLSYFGQTNPVLDPIYTQRFPVPRASLPQFDPGFRWMNFWNFTDPITEFYGLDEYQVYDQGTDKSEPRRQSAISPEDIKTRDNPLLNHGEYWTNREQVHRPLVQRLLGNDKPPAWERSGYQARKLWWPLSGLSTFLRLPAHVFLTGLAWIIALVLLAGMAANLGLGLRAAGLLPLLESISRAVNVSGATAVSEATAHSPLLGQWLAGVANTWRGTGQLLASTPVTYLRYSLAYAALLVAFYWGAIETVIAGVTFPFTEPAPQESVDED